MWGVQIKGEKMLRIKVEDNKKYSRFYLKCLLLCYKSGDKNNGGKVQYSKERIKTREQKHEDKVLRKISKNHNEFTEWCFHLSL